MIDFEEGNLTAGTTITDQFEGLNISTPSEFGVMVFDTNNPTGEDLNPLSEDTDTSSGATQLTNIGWEKNGQQLGTWTNNSDVVKDLVSGIEVVDNVTAKTLAGNDLIEGLVSSGTGFLNNGTIITGSGNDSLQGSVIGAGNENAGLSNVGDFGDIDSIINTGSGADKIVGTVKIQGDGNSNSGVINDIFGQINTEAGDDQITGMVEVEGKGDFNIGFYNNFALTDTGAGKDRITSTVKVEGDGNNNLGIFNNESRIIY